MKTSRYKDLGPLHDLLLEACPPDDNGRKSIVHLADLLECSHQYVYRWIEKGRVPPDFAKRIAGLPGGAVPIEKFYPFVFV
mgnify:CR=1 FL=1